MRIFISLSAIRLSDYKKWGGQKVFDKNYYKALFERYSKKKNAYRIYLPIVGKGKYVSTVTAPKEIEDFVVEKGYKIEDYLKGIVSVDKGKRILKIGKLLKDRPDLLDLYQKHKAKAGVKDNSNVLVVISRHPYDIAGMSTGRGWTSCTNLGIGIGNEPHHTRVGVYHEKVIDDVKHNFLIAYVIKKDDPNIKNPIARLRILKYVNKKTNEYHLKQHDKIYSTEVPGFAETVQAWLDEVNTSSNGNYDLPDSVYEDEADTSTRVLTFKNTEDFVEQWGKLDSGSKKIVAERVPRNVDADVFYQHLKKSPNLLVIYLENATNIKHIIEASKSNYISLLDNVITNKNTPKEAYLNIINGKYFSLDLSGSDDTSSGCSFILQNIRSKPFREELIRLMYEKGSEIDKAYIFKERDLPSRFVLEVLKTSKVKTSALVRISQTTTSAEVLEEILKIDNLDAVVSVVKNSHCTTDLLAKAFDKYGENSEVKSRILYNPNLPLGLLKKIIAASPLTKDETEIILDKSKCPDDIAFYILDNCKNREMLYTTIKILSQVSESKPVLKRLVEEISKDPNNKVLASSTYAIVESDLLDVDSLLKLGKLYPKNARLIRQLIYAPLADDRVFREFADSKSQEIKLAVAYRTKDKDIIEKFFASRNTKLKLAILKNEELNFNPDTLLALAKSPLLHLAIMNRTDCDLKTLEFIAKKGKIKTLYNLAVKEETPTSVLDSINIEKYVGDGFAVMSTGSELTYRTLKALSKNRSSSPKLLERIYKLVTGPKYIDDNRYVIDLIKSNPNIDKKFLSMLGTPSELAKRR